MQTELLKTVGQISGIGGIALGVFLLLYRDIIRKKIFPSLTKKQGFQLLMLISVLVWSIALAGIGAWVWTTKMAGDENSTIEQKVEGGTGVIVKSDGDIHGDIHIGITLEEYEARLKAREKEITENLEKAHEKDNAQQRKLYETELEGIQQRLQDSKLSYQEHIEDLRKRIVQLESIRGQVPDDVLAQAQAALARGDAEKADALFQQIEDQAAASIKVAGEARYQRCQIALDAIRYQEAFTHCQRALQLVPDNATYLKGVGDMARILGRYHLAMGYYQQALASDLKTYGEDHPDVARDRNDLGTAWYSLGEYQKAIGYYEQALTSAEKTLGTDHPNTKKIRQNLAVAKDSVE